MVQLVVRLNMNKLNKLNDDFEKNMLKNSKRGVTVVICGMILYSSFCIGIVVFLGWVITKVMEHFGVI